MPPATRPWKSPKEYSESNHLNRLLYSMRTGRCGDPDTYVFTDSYGVSYMNLPAGINPVSYLDSEELSLILSFFGTRFDVVICDAGTCLREENIRIMEDSDALLSFERGRRYLGLERLPGAAAERLQRIRMSGGPEEAAAVDEAVRQIYGEKGRS